MVMNCRLYVLVSPWPCTFPAAFGEVLLRPGCEDCGIRLRATLDDSTIDPPKRYHRIRHKNLSLHLQNLHSIQSTKWKPHQSTSRCTPLPANQRKFIAKKSAHPASKPMSHLCRPLPSSSVFTELKC